MNNLTFTVAVIFAVAFIANFIMVQANLQIVDEKTPDNSRWSAEAPFQRTARRLRDDESAPGRGGWPAAAPFTRTARRLRDDESAPGWSGFKGPFIAPLLIRTDRRVTRSVHDSMEAPISRGGVPYREERALNAMNSGEEAPIRRGGVPYREERAYNPASYVVYTAPGGFSGSGFASDS